MPHTIIFNTGSILFTTTSLSIATGSTTSSLSNHPIWSGSNPANNVSSSAYAAVSYFTSSFVSISVSQSLHHYGNTTTTGSFEMIGVVTESNGYASHSRFYRHVTHNATTSVFPRAITSSLSLGFSDDGDWSIYKPLESNPTRNFTQHEKTFMYVSRSGKLGFKTENPKDDIDFKADSIKFRSDDGSKELEFTNGKFTTKKFKGIATGGETVTETSGSEIVMSYTPGTFNAPSTASVGDALGTITWEDLSISERRDATAMQIQGVVNGVANDGSAIKGSMNFAIGSSVAGEPISETMQLHEGGLILSSSKVDYDASLHTHGKMYVGHTYDDSDREIIFYNQEVEKRWVIGVDESQSKFSIHSSIGFTTNNDFELDAAGNVVIQGDLYADQLRVTGGYPTFTGSVLPIDGGTF